MREIEIEIELDPKLASEIKKYGKFDISGCYDCGSCTLNCQLSKEPAFSVRKFIRMIIYGLKDSLKSSLEPWLCFHCGDCSEQCPRGAQPSETIRTLRRYLICVYDWTGFSRKLYTSKLWQILSLSIVAILTFAFFLWQMTTRNIESLTKLGHFVNLCCAASIVCLFFLPNILRMYYFTMKGTKIPLVLYIKHLPELISHKIVQIRFFKCPNDKSFGYIHFFFASSYVLTLIFLGLLNWFEFAKYPLYHPLVWLGYYACIVLTISSLYIIIERIRKKKLRFKYTHLSGWLFMIWMFIIPVVALVTFISKSLGLYNLASVSYVFFITILIPWILILVPFGQWMYIIYSPLGVYFATLKEEMQKFNRGGTND